MAAPTSPCTMDPDTRLRQWKVEYAEDFTFAGVSIGGSSRSTRSSVRRLAARRAVPDSLPPTAHSRCQTGASCVPRPFARTFTKQGGTGTTPGQSHRQSLYPMGLQARCG